MKCIVVTASVCLSGKIGDVRIPLSRDPVGVKFDMYIMCHSVVWCVFINEEPFSLYLNATSQTLRRFDEAVLHFLKSAFGIIVLN